MKQHELNLKARLCNAIQKWIDDEAENHDEDWSELNTYVGHNIANLMTDAAFPVLLAMSDLSAYLREQEIEPI